MDKLKYDSIYKFIVSLGIIIIVLPFIISYYFFNNNEIILINQEQISKLTEISVKIVEFKQNFILNLINQIVYIGIAVIIIEIIGVILIIIGLILWHKNIQDIENKKLMLEYKISEKNLMRLSANEKKNKVKEEISNNSSKINKNKINAIEISKYLEKENEIVKNIEIVFNEYSILRDVKVGKFSIDCLVSDSTYKIMYPQAFEIKYIKDKKININQINSIKRTIENIQTSYKKNLFTFCLVYVLIVVDKLDDKFIIENGKEIEEIKKYNNDKTYVNKILIVDNDNIKEKLITLKELKEISF